MALLGHFFFMETYGGLSTGDIMYPICYNLDEYKKKYACDAVAVCLLYLNSFSFPFA